MFRHVHNCRVCGSGNLVKYVDFGMMPLANSHVNPSSMEKEHTFPLEVMLCRDCSLSMLSIVVQPELMFSNYSYHSSVSKTFQNHCNELAKQMKSLFGNEGALVVDIASNDGCMLREFRKYGFGVLGVEPAGNLAEKANKEGIETIPEFWGRGAVEKIIAEHGKAGIITATNVFAHVDDLHDFARNVKRLLSDDGVFIIEVPYAINLIKKREFDTIYHEHLSYFLVKPLLKLFESEGMEVKDVEENQIHGGSIRFFVAKKSNRRLPLNLKRIEMLLGREEKEKMYSEKTYFDFANELLEIKIDLLTLLSKLSKEGMKIGAYGASAKGNTLLNYSGISSDFVGFIIDDTPEKQNMLYAGNHIPIYPFGELEKRKPDYLIILAWNFAREIMDKTQGHQERVGK